MQYQVDTDPEYCANNLLLAQLKKATAYQSFRYFPYPNQDVWLLPDALRKSSQVFEK